MENARFMAGKRAALTLIRCVWGSVRITRRKKMKRYITCKLCGRRYGRHFWGIYRWALHWIDAVDEPHKGALRVVTWLK